MTHKTYCDNCNEKDMEIRELQDKLKADFIDISEHPKYKEIIDSHFEFLQELIKVLEIKQELPPNLDDWEEIIKDEIRDIKKQIPKYTFDDKDRLVQKHPSFDSQD